LGDGALSEITDLLERDFDRLADLFNGIASALPEALAIADVSGITDGLNTIREAVSSLFGDLDFTDAQDLARAIEFIANSFESLSNFSAGAIESFGPVIQAIADFADDAARGGDAARELGLAFGQLTQLNIAAGAISGVTSVLGDLALVIIGAGSAKGLLGGTRALVASLSGPAGLVSQLGLLAGAGAAGFGLGKLANEVSRLTTGETLSQKLSDWFTGFTNLNEQALELQETIRPTAEQAAQDIQSLDDALNRSNQSIKESVDFWGLYGSESGTAIATIENLDKEWNEIQEAIKGAADETTRLEQETQKITTDEKLALIKGNSEIAVAGIQATSQVLSSAFESAGVSVDATAESLDNLFGLLGDENISKFDKLGIKEQIDIANDRQDQTLKQQKRLIDEQIREIRDRREAFRNGGALIRIDGDGLQPHLEAFMFEILESIQVRVNAEGYNLLLGAGA